MTDHQMRVLVPGLLQFSDLSLLLLRVMVAAVLVMLGAIQKKIFVWRTGFWGERSSGWHYDLLLAVASLVIATTGGGRYVLLG